MECNKEANLADCTCTYKPVCERKGICCECVTHHRSRRQLPACFFSPQAERTYDRSVDKFIEDSKNRF